MILTRDGIEITIFRYNFSGGYYAEAKDASGNRLAFTGVFRGKGGKQRAIEAALAAAKVGSPRRTIAVCPGNPTTDLPMHLLYVGGVLRTPPWPEGGEFNFHGTAGEPGGACDLGLRYDKPSPREIAAVSTGKCEFALVEFQGVIFFLYRFEPGIPWSDCPYTWQLLPENRRVPPPAEGSADARQMLNIVLLDAPTGVIKALRAVSLSPEFTLALHNAIRRQIAQVGWSREKHVAAIAAAYRRWPYSDQMAALASVRCEGGS